MQPSLLEDSPTIVKSVMQVEFELVETKYERLDRQPKTIISRARETN